MEKPEPDQSGDYEYDLAHEQAMPRRSVEKTAGPHRQHPPAGRAVAYESDMGYDEAHDF